ncbi:MAG: GNAT family N-acetyltransferase [Tannerellaceae bacterium]|nr:GNAT family N-acetyltransferase [Tannerellaceae bacterium]
MDQVHIYRLREVKDKWFDKFMDIYKVSFPFFEQRTLAQQETAFKDEKYHLDLYIREDTCLAFIAYWDFPEYIYIEHLAVNPEIRGQQLGSKILSDFGKQASKTILLEIDPLTDEVSKKRWRFYEKLGFHMNTYSHTHPPYQKGCNSHELLVLSLDQPLNPNLFHTFTTDLTQVVMNFEV